MLLVARTVKRLSVIKLITAFGVTMVMTILSTVLEMIRIMVDQAWEMLSSLMMFSEIMISASMVTLFC